METICFDVKEFWKNKFNLDKILEQKRSYKAIDKIFTEKYLIKGFDEKPYFYHPLSYWLFNGDLSKARSILQLLELQLYEFQINKIIGFEERIKKLQSEYTQESFYSFLSELTIAWHFKDSSVEFIVSPKPKVKQPDLLIIDKLNNKLFIEVYTNFKFYFRLQRIAELFEAIDYRLHIARNLFLQSPPSDLSRERINQMATEILQKIESKEIQNQIRSEYQIVLFEKDNLQIYLEIDENFRDGKNYNSKLIKNGFADYNITFKEQLLEIINGKIKYGQLKNYHPNIFAANMSFNEDYFMGKVIERNMDMKKILNSKIPEYVDNFYMYFNGIDSELKKLEDNGCFLKYSNEKSQGFF